jgi:DNA-binding response OmpR family regulator
MSGELDPALNNALADRLRLEGADGLIAKPMRPAALVAVVAAVAARGAGEPGTPAHLPDTLPRLAPDAEDTGCQINERPPLGASRPTRGGP